MTPITATRPAHSAPLSDMLAAERNGLLRASRPPCRLAVFRPAFCSSRRQRCAQLHAKRDKRAEEPPSIQEFLGTVLKDELKIEKERYRQSEELMDGPPKPWKVEDRPFTNVITLARTFKGEEILVRCQSGMWSTRVIIVRRDAWRGLTCPQASVPCMRLHAAATAAHATPTLTLFAPSTLATSYDAGGGRPGCTGPGGGAG